MICNFQLLTANLSSCVMQSLLKAWTKLKFRVFEVVDGDHLCGVRVHLAFQCAAVGGINPVLDNQVVFDVDEEVPAVDVKHFFHADIILGEVVLFHLGSEGVDDGEALTEGLKLPVDIVGPALCIGTIVPVLTCLDVPEAVDAQTIVVGFVVTMSHIGLVALGAQVVDGDEEIIGGRVELIGTCKSLRGRFHGYFNHSRNIVRIKNGESGHGLVIAVVAGGDDAAFAYPFRDNLNAVAKFDSLETDDFWSIDFVASVVTVVERPPNDGVAQSHLEFIFVYFLSRNKAAETKNHEG